MTIDNNCNFLTLGSFLRTLSINRSSRNCGHGEFKQNNVRFGAAYSPLCDSCGFLDTVKHAFFECWEVVEERQVAENTVGGPLSN